MSTKVNKATWVIRLENTYSRRQAHPKLSNVQWIYFGAVGERHRPFPWGIEEAVHIYAHCDESYPDLPVAFGNEETKPSE